MSALTLAQEVWQAVEQLPPSTARTLLEQALTSMDDRAYTDRHDPQEHDVAPVDDVLGDLVEIIRNREGEDQ